MTRPRVLITGIGGPAGTAAAMFFLALDYMVIGTDIVPGGIGVPAFRLVPRGDDPAFRVALLELLDEFHPDLLLPTVSEELQIVACMRKEIRARGTEVWISEPAAVDIANDKLLTALRLQSLGCRSPLTLDGSHTTDPLKVASLLGYPFLAKPRVGRGGRGVRVFATPEEALTEARTEIVYQEFLPGEEFDVNLFVRPAGETKAAVVLLKTAMKQGRTGNATGVLRVERRDVADVAVDAAHKLRLEGPVDMDIRLDAQGRPTILEINARLGANALSAREILTMIHELAQLRMGHDAPLHARVA